VRKKKINSTADSGSSRNPRERVVSHWMALVNRVVAVTPPKLELSWRSQSHEDVDMHQSSENDDMSVDSAGSSPRGLLEVSSPPGHAR